MTMPNGERAAAGRRAADDPSRTGPAAPAAAVPGPSHRPIPDQRSATEAPPVTTGTAGMPIGGSWSPGASVAARRRIPALNGRWIDPGTKGVVIAGDGSGHCTVRFHTGEIIAGLDGDDIVVIPDGMRC
jgi:hypothetical protein